MMIIDYDKNSDDYDDDDHVQSGCFQIQNGLIKKNFISHQL